jgi:4-oxalocrotonate tautomerase
MPLVEVTLTQGRSDEQLRSLIAELHDAVVRTGVAEAPAVRVIVREVPATHWASGGVTIAERRAGQTSP